MRYALFDLDNTIYPHNSGLWEAIAERINRYMIEKLGMDPTIVMRRREEYLRSFGTTLNGLRREHFVDAADFLRFIHDLPLEKYLKADASLDAMLGRLPLAKIIFTNADAHHARRVLSRLGVHHHFERIIDIHALEFVNKPDPGAYRKALDIIGAEPEECLFVDDSPLNLAPARELGMLTVLVCAPGSNLDGVNHIIHHMIELEPLLAGRLGAGRGCSGAI